MESKAGASANRSPINPVLQPIGPSIGSWAPPPPPPRRSLIGRFCRVEPLDPRRHGNDLATQLCTAANDPLWTYLPYGPFKSGADYLDWLHQNTTGEDPQFYAIVEQSSAVAVGVASYLRITPASGSIEVGHLQFSPRLQRTPAATEAMVLMMRKAFELGYRRYEWKCDALNAKSRRAALRLGLSFEGIFRQATVYKGRSRDTAWFAAIDGEWEKLSQAFEQWLAPENFDATGQQRIALSTLTTPLLRPIIAE